MPERGADRVLQAETPERADELYKKTCDLLRQMGLCVETGQFQTHMQVHLVNDGPVTLLLDSKNCFDGGKHFVCNRDKR